MSETTERLNKSFDQLAADIDKLIAIKRRVTEDRRALLGAAKWALSAIGDSNLPIPVEVAIRLRTAIDQAERPL
jgi:hypothetical protein